MTKQQIAVAFSNGKFETVYSYLAENVKWTVVGEDEFMGKQAVMNNCEQVAVYFKTVTTNFETLHTIADGNKVVIAGTAEFMRDGRTLSFVSACDVYEFDDHNELITITSFCITEKQ